MTQTDKQSPIIYLAQLEGTMLAKRRLILQQSLEALKKGNYDKAEMKKKRKEIIAQMNSLTYDIDGKLAEVYRQNYEVVKMMLMMFAGQDFITRLYDEAADLFKRITVGKKQGELLDFVKLCQEVANKANEVVQVIASAGKDAMSMAYATMEDGIGDGLLDMLREKIDAYGHTPEGRKYFYGDHLR